MAQIGAQFVNAVSGLPVGTVIYDYPSNSIPNGWIATDGQAVSRTDYAALFNVLGTTYGAGNGSTTFNLPKQAIVSDANGYVGLPYQPMFSARATAGNTAGNRWQNYVDVSANVGNHFNVTTGLFTTPVAGKYFFTFSAFTEAGQSAQLNFYVNSVASRRVYSANGTSTYVGINPGIAIFNLSVGDTVGVYIDAGQTHYNLNNYFVGWKIA